MTLFARPAKIPGARHSAIRPISAAQTGDRGNPSNKLRIDGEDAREDRKPGARGHVLRALYSTRCQGKRRNSKKNYVESPSLPDARTHRKNEPGARKVV